MPKKQEKSEGLHPFHYGFVLGNNFFPPSEFAIAWIGVTNPKKLEQTLDVVVDKILSGGYKQEETHLLYHLVNKIKKEEGRKLNLDDLRFMAKEVYCGSKIVDREALIEVNKKGHIGTFSDKDTLSMRIESRRPGQIQRSYKVTLYNPLVKDLEEALSLHMSGGTLHLGKNQAKGNHWSKGLAHEEDFVSNLAKHVDKHFEDKQIGYNIKRNDVIGDYNRILNIVDYAMASALTGLNQVVKSGQMFRIKGLELKEGERVLMPFDFDNTPQYAFEAFLQLHHNLGKKETDKLFDKRLFCIDEFLIGKKGFVTPLFRELYEKGIASKGVVVRDKSFTKYSWAIIQAWEMHSYEEGRRFSGHALEFVGTPYQTVSIVFDDMFRKLSIRIIYDKKLGMPYIMYKDYSPKEGFEGVWALGDRSPLKMVNIAKDIHNRRIPIKRWIEQDYKTGRKALCFIYEPTREVRESTNLLSKQVGRGIFPEEIRSKYIENFMSSREK